MSNREVLHQLVSSVREVVHQVASNPKIAVTVSGSTIGSGIGTILEWIPNDIGKLATLVGMVLSVVLIYTHLYAHLATRRRERMEHKKIMLEIEELRGKVAEPPRKR